MEQEKIFIAADAAEQDTLEAGVYTILKRWELQRATEENYKAMQKEVCDFCRYWFVKNGVPKNLTRAIRKINIKCEILLAGLGQREDAAHRQHKSRLAYSRRN